MTTTVKQEVRTPQIGDTIYIPTAWAYGDKRVPCPVCFGKMAVVVILGNGEHQTVECDVCSRGFERATGWVNEPCAGSRVDEATVDGLTMDYGTLKATANHSKVTMGLDAFWTKEEAEAVRETLFTQAQIDAENNKHRRFGYETKKLTWKVYYHRAELKKAQRAVEYHSEHLSDTLARQRKPKVETEPHCGLCQQNHATHTVCHPLTAATPSSGKPTEGG